MTMVIALCTSSAWAQSVISVGTNLDFSEGTPVDNGICTCDYDMEKNSTVYSQMQAVTGWELGNENGNNRAAGVFAYGSNHWLGGTGYNVPATNPEGVAEGNALGVVAVWSATAQYVQSVTLEAGDYVISIPVYNAVGGTTAPTKNLIGFIADNGTEYLAAAKAYPVDTWTVENIKFTLTETTTGKLSLGYTAPNSGSGANQHLFFDKVEVLAVTETDLARVDLNAALVSAQATVDAKAGVGAGLFMYSEEAYNTYAAAVAAAKAVSENPEATKDALVEALAALNAATEAYTVTAPAADAVYAVKFNGTDNYLTIGESNITIEAAADTLSFEAVGNGKYYIHDNEGKYLSYAGNNKWTMTASADVKDEWAVSVNAEGLYTLTGKNGGLGVDGTEAGATCYGDKNGTAVATWTITEIVAEDTPDTPEEPKTDYTDAIVNADLSTTDAWNADGTKGIKDGMVKVGSQAVYDFCQTITLPAGQYKMTAKAVYRYGNTEQEEYDAIQAGTETHKTKLYAETATKKYEANVQNRYDGASDTDYAAGNGSVTINGKFVPNSSAAVQAWFNGGQYVNELVFNVYEDGQVKIGITTADGIAGDYTNIGAWTLTRLGDAVEETPEEPEVPVYTMVQNEADLVAGEKYLIMAEVDGGWVALSDQSGTIRVPSDTLSVTESWTVETVVATAVAESPAIFVGAAYELTLEGEPGAWKFKDELNGTYLHWTGSKNTLTSDATGSAWTIEFNQYAHNAVITHAETTNRVLQYNVSSPRFCAYTSVQAPVYLFKAGEVTVAPVAPSNPSFNTIAELLAFEIGNVVELNVNEAKITYLKGNNMSITDGTDTLAIYDYNIPSNYVAEGYLSGKITATLSEYKGNKQFTVVDWSEVTFSEPPYFADGDYLIVNTETGCYLGGGNDWGTHATLLGKPQFFTFAYQGNNAYTLDSHQSNGGDSHFLATSLYCDGAAANWTFVKNENGNYTINNSGNYLAGNGANNVIVTVTEVSAAAEWTVISKAEAFAALDVATQETPVDATIYISNPECKRNAGGWTITSADGTGTPSNHAMGSGGNTANCSESYHSTNGFDMSQVLVGMKPGVYRLDAHAFYRNDGDNTGALPYIYVNDQQSLFPERTGSENSMAAAYASFLNGDYAIEPIYFTVAEGDEVKIGAHGENNAFWNIWGEFGLTYYGDAPVEPEYLPIVAAKVGEVAIVDGAATVTSISSIDIFFDRPVVLAENAGWATLTDSYGPINLNAEVFGVEFPESSETEEGSSECVVHFSVPADFNGEFTEAGDYLLNIPEGFIVGVENADFINAEITATITIEGASVTPLAVVNVTVGEDVMADLSAVVATPEDMIKVNFDGQFYFQGMPVIVDAEGNDASDSFDFVNGLDFDGSNAYILMGKKAGIYTITLPKASFMEMMSWKAPAEDIVLTVQIIAPTVEGKKVVYDLDVEREAGLGYAAQEYTIATSELAALLGVETLEGATIWGVNPDGSYVADAMTAYDGWRAVDGTFAGWSTETAAVCVKLFAEEAAYLISICTHGGNGNDPAVGTQSTASWALIAGVDTVVINTNITFVEPTVINIADFEVVSTITVEHNETAGVAYSGNTAVFDPISTAAALGVASLDEADQYILNVTTGDLVANTTDGWRDANGDAAGWGATGGVCVKIQQPSAGSIDYIGCYDTTHEAGEVYTAKWAFVHDGKAVVIEVVITFIPGQGIENIKSLENAVIYTISGTRVQGDVKSLERGIYIVNGRKMFVK